MVAIVKTEKQEGFWDSMILFKGMTLVILQTRLYLQKA